LPPSSRKKKSEPARATSVECSAVYDSAMPSVVNLASKLASFEDLWVPKVVGELNGQYVKVAKFQGEYVWHSHEHEDELFWVLSGRLVVELRGRTVYIGPGEFVIVPRGVEHRPVAEKLVECVLFEPASTRNTGEVDHDYTIEPDALEKI
jgi:mannose-6-phosphate isomerase-like protein (cupin superfamily)